MTQQAPPRGVPAGTIGVGGPIDRTSVSLSVYDDDLDLDRVTATLGCKPTVAHRKGDKTRRGHARRIGVWSLRHEGTDDPERLACVLLDRLPTEERIWKRLSKEYDVNLWFGLFLDRWNRGLLFSDRIGASMGALRLRRCLAPCVCPTRSMAPRSSST